VGAFSRNSSRVRVYANADDEYFGCSYRSGQKVGMGYESGSSSGYFTVGPIRLAHDTVAWQEAEGHDYVDGYWESALYVRNARTGRRLRSIELRRGAYVTAIALVPDGAIAWLSARDTSSDATPSSERVVEYRLNRYDRDGLVQLDRGTGDQGPMSLRQHGSKIEWVSGGVMRTAKLR
jgi:hypothetical protein